MKARHVVFCQVLVGMLFAAPAFTQPVGFSPSKIEPELVLHGSQAQESYGIALAALGDLTGTGVAKFAVGSPNYSDAGGQRRGKVEVRGVDGSVLYTFLGNAAFDSLGSSVANIGDVNGDQVSDILIGAMGGEYVQVRSGANGTLIRQTNGSAYAVGPGGFFGWAVAAVGDLDQDTVNDYIVSAPYGGPNGYGLVLVFSGATGLQIPGGSIQGFPNLPGIGHSLAKLGDIDNDGRPDFILGTPYTSTGTVVIVSGQTFAILRTQTGTPSPHFSYEFGNSVAGLGDISGDGIADYAVTEHGTNSAQIFSGANGALLHGFTPEPSQANPIVNYGMVVASAGDVDRDGVPDILISQQTYLNAVLPNSGAIYVYSGRTFAMLDLFVTGPDCQFELLQGLTSLGDINGDGYPDIAFSSPSANNGTIAGAGRVYIQRLVGAKTFGDNVNRGLTLEFFPGPLVPGSMKWAFLKISGGRPHDLVFVGAATQVSPLSPNVPVLIDLFNFPAIPGLPYGVAKFDNSGSLFISLLPFYRVNWMRPRETIYIQAAEFLRTPLGYTTSKGLMFTPPWP